MNWGDWSTCDVSCDDGAQTRTRQCSNPIPVNGGLPCTGEDLETSVCSNPICPGKLIAYQIER